MNMLASHACDGLCYGLCYAPSSSVLNYIQLKKVTAALPSSSSLGGHTATQPSNFPTTTMSKVQFFSQILTAGGLKDKATRYDLI